MTPEEFTTKPDVLSSPETLSRLAGLGMKFAAQKIDQTASITPVVETRSAAFKEYLAYVVFGRITRLSQEALAEDHPHATSVTLVEELGRYINESINKSAVTDLKGIDFADHKQIEALRKSWESINDEPLFVKLDGGDDMTIIRNFGSRIVPENPKTEQKPQSYENYA